MTTAEPPPYVIVRQGGRGRYRLAHLLADDGNNPRCGARLNPDHWTLERAGQRGTIWICKQCAAQVRREHAQAATGAIE
jgi:hypothetical protein